MRAGADPIAQSRALAPSTQQTSGVAAPPRQRSRPPSSTALPHRRRHRPQRRVWDRDHPGRQRGRRRTRSRDHRGGNPGHRRDGPEFPLPARRLRTDIDRSEQPCFCSFDRCSQTRPAGSSSPDGRWSVPVAYAPFGEDLAEVSATLRLSDREIVAAHTGAEFRVYMLGFQPGLPNLGGLPPRLHISRRTAPRPPVPAAAS